VPDFSTTKTLITPRTGDPSPHWYGIPVRIFLLTFIGTLSAFAVSLFLAILGIMLIAALRGRRPDMTIAYWHIALPLALVAGGIIFLFATALEIRYYRQHKALRALERMG
jgi:amino acid transporter